MYEMLEKKSRGQVRWSKGSHRQFHVKITLQSVGTRYLGLLPKKQSAQ